MATQRPLAELAEEDPEPLIPRSLLGGVATVWLAYNFRLHRAGLMAQGPSKGSPAGAYVEGALRWEDETTRRRLAEALVGLLSEAEPIFTLAAAYRLKEEGLVRQSDQATSAEIQPWLLAALKEAPPHRKGDNAALVDLLDFCLLAAAWQLFLTQLTRHHPWLLDELQAVGFDPGRADANLALYLLRRANA